MTTFSHCCADDIAEILIPTDRIQTRVQELGTAISEDYAGRDLLLVGILKGMAIFMADLLRAITIPVSVDYLATSHYGPASHTLGVVRIVKDLDSPIEGRHVLFVEDMIDTGLTLGYILRHLRAMAPASLEVCALFNKPVRRLIDIPIAYKGFDLPDCFVVGYGLDYRQHYRNLPFIGVLKPAVYHPTPSKGS